VIFQHSRVICRQAEDDFAARAFHAERATHPPEGFYPYSRQKSSILRTPRSAQTASLHKRAVVSQAARLRLARPTCKGLEIISHNRTFETQNKNENRPASTEKNATFYTSTLLHLCIKCRFDSVAYIAFSLAICKMRVQDSAITEKERPMSAAVQRLAAAEAKAKAAAERAAELEKRAAEIKRQIAAKEKLVADRVFEVERKKWGKRPRETHQKVLAGVAVIGYLRSLSDAERPKLQRALLGQLVEKDRATLLDLDEFQNEK
jgi:hypothetical protein